MDMEFILKKTTILIPDELRNHARKVARFLGISFGELARNAIAEYLKKPLDLKREDPFFADDSVYEGSVPYNGSATYEDSLYDKQR